MQAASGARSCGTAAAKRREAAALQGTEQIIGFRQDRIGARLVCLLNVMRLNRRFGLGGRFMWLSEPRGPYPELADPALFFDESFCRQQLQVVASAPDPAGRQNLGTVSAATGSAHFAERLARGERFLIDAMVENLRFVDESPEGVDREIREIAAGIRLAQPLRRALRHARARLAEVGEGQTVAIHVRRGDILDGDPWSYSSWASKYVPDEFFRAFIAARQGAVVAFSDTPAAVAHLAQGAARVIPVGALFDDPDLSVAQRDLLELLLMGGCAEVGAPVLSAFSRAASVVGGVRVVALPAMLPPGPRRAAYDALLDRVIRDPDSFLVPGDLAQSAHYAAAHAATVGRAPELVEALAAQPALLDRFPFLYRALAVAALAGGMTARARELAGQGLAHPLLRNRDRPQCQQVLLVAGAAASAGRSAALPGPDATPDATPGATMPDATGADATGAEFLRMILSGRAAEGTIVPALAHRILGAPGPVPKALMFPRELLDIHALPAPDPLGGGGSVATLPLWVLRGDWSELIADPAVQRELVLNPPLAQRLAPVASLLGPAERVLAAGQDPALPPDPGPALLGLAAAQLRLNGRLRRAFAVLHWLDRLRPDDALTAKRLADACYTADNRRAGDRWLARALELRPDNALLHYSAALRAAQADRPRARRLHLAEAERLWPGLDLSRILRKAVKISATVTAGAATGTPPQGSA